MKQPPVAERFQAALDELTLALRADRSILATILCGSLSHDAVWAKSDIDLILVAIDDNKVDKSHCALYANGLNVHAHILTRGEFRKTTEGSIRNSFMHSLLAKGRLLYTHDDTIPSMLAQLSQIGERDTQIQLLSAGIEVLLPLDKAHKWMITRGDLDYSALWILYTASTLARIEILSARQIVDREVMPHAMRLNPDFFRIIYTDLLNSKKTRKNVQAALDAMDAYLAARAPALFGLVIEYLRDAAEARSSTELETHFKRTYGLYCVTSACEYLSDLHLIGKVSTPVQITRRSNVSMQELAFVYLGD